ncbi:hypothetical protein V9K67_09605 [Paraflavisolibacter sp. H34]|uniref:hypothetical protein n=1 Tax=Huijunlia imazamoxiresistens TaxID=3127457 RepID=UPI003019E639
MDPEVLKYFKKIVFSFSLGFFWLFSMATLGIYFQLGLPEGGLHWYNLLFYGCVVFSLLALLFYYVRLWRS